MVKKHGPNFWLPPLLLNSTSLTAWVFVQMRKTRCCCVEEKKLSATLRSEFLYLVRCPRDAMKHVAGSLIGEIRYQQKNGHQSTCTAPFLMRFVLGCRELSQLLHGVFRFHVRPETADQQASSRINFTGMLGGKGFAHTVNRRSGKSSKSGSDCSRAINGAKLTFAKLFAEMFWITLVAAMVAATHAASSNIICSDFGKGGGGGGFGGYYQRMAPANCRGRHGDMANWRPTFRSARSMGGACKAGFSKYKGKCYKYMEDWGHDITFRKAETLCNLYGGHVYVPNDKAEHRFVETKQVTPHHTWHWLGIWCFPKGGESRNPAEFYTVTGEDMRVIQKKLNAKTDPIDNHNRPCLLWHPRHGRSLNWHHKHGHEGHRTIYIVINCCFTNCLMKLLLVLVLFGAAYAASKTTSETVICSDYRAGGAAGGGGGGGQAGYYVRPVPAHCRARHVGNFRPNHRINNRRSSCPGGWKKFRNACYYDRRRHGHCNFRDCENWCNGQSAHIMVPNDRLEYMFVEAAVMRHNEWYWTGFFCADQGNSHQIDQFYTVTGASSNIICSVFGKGGGFGGYYQRMAPANCRGRHGDMANWRPTFRSARSMGGACKAGFSKYKGKCYKYMEDWGHDITFRKAETLCNLYGGHVYVPNDKAEHRFIETKQVTPHHTWHWLGIWCFPKGGESRNPAEFYTVTGEDMRVIQKKLNAKTDPIDNHNRPCLLFHPRHGRSLHWHHKHGHEGHRTIYIVINCCFTNCLMKLLLVLVLFGAAYAASKTTSETVICSDYRAGGAAGGGGGGGQAGYYVRPVPAHCRARHVGNFRPNHRINNRRSSCPGGWKKFRNACYYDRRRHGHCNFRDCENWCNGQSAHIMVPNDRLEYMFVEAAVMRHNEWYWTGFFCADQGNSHQIDQFYTVTGEDTRIIAKKIKAITEHPIDRDNHPCMMSHRHGLKKNSVRVSRYVCILEHQPVDIQGQRVSGWCSRFWGALFYLYGGHVYVPNDKAEHRFVETKQVTPHHTWHWLGIWCFPKGGESRNPAEFYTVTGEDMRVIQKKLNAKTDPIDNHNRPCLLFHPRHGRSLHWHHKHGHEVSIKFVNTMKILMKLLLVLVLFGAAYAASKTTSETVICSDYRAGGAVGGGGACGGGGGGGQAGYYVRPVPAHCRARHVGNFRPNHRINNRRSSCPGGWKKFRNACYYDRRRHGHCNFRDCENWCNGQSAHIMVPNDRLEYMFVEAAVMRHNEWYWTGFFCADQGNSHQIDQFYTVTGEDTRIIAKQLKAITEHPIDRDNHPCMMSHRHGLKKNSVRVSRYVCILEHQPVDIQGQRVSGWCSRFWRFTGRNPFPRASHLNKNRFLPNICMVRITTNCWASWSSGKVEKNEDSFSTSTITVLSETRVVSYCEPNGFWKEGKNQDTSCKVRITTNCWASWSSGKVEKNEDSFSTSTITVLSETRVVSHCEPNGFWKEGKIKILRVRNRPKQADNQNSLFRSRDCLSANQGPLFPDSVGS
eukprot:sb/3460872/